MASGKFWVKRDMLGIEKEVFKLENSIVTSNNILDQFKTKPNQT